MAIAAGRRWAQRARVPVPVPAASAAAGQRRYVEAVRAETEAPPHAASSSSSSPTTASAHFLCVHGNGFSKEMFVPLVDDLFAAGNCAGAGAGADAWRTASVTLFDLWGHGESSPSLAAGADAADTAGASLIEAVHGWDVFAEDLDAVLRGFPPPCAGRADLLVGVGFSLGGAVCLKHVLAARDHNAAPPRAFDGLVLLEPIVPNPQLPGYPDRLAWQNPLAEKTARLPDEFSSVDDALAFFRRVRIVSDAWDPRSAAPFLRGLLVEDAARGVWRLRCPRALEAEIFRTGATHRLWERLPDVTLPVTLIAGRESRVYVQGQQHEHAKQQEVPGFDWAALCRRFEGAEWTAAHIVEGASHFLPLEKPRETAALIAEHVSRLAAARASRL